MDCLSARLPDKFSGIDDFLFVLLLIGVFGAVGGFLYETAFYRIAWGYFVKRGTSFGPWIPIYGAGAVFMTLSVWRFRKNPLTIFLVSFCVTGILEFFVGYALFHTFGGLRLWDYNTEPWNFGNIGGYVCLRSVGIFGFFGFLLFYGVIPMVLWIQRNLSKIRFRILSAALASAFLCDIAARLVIRGFPA